MAVSDLSASLTLAAHRLAALPEAERVQAEDPRFSALMRAIDPEAHTAAELAERLLARTRDPLNAAVAAAQVQRLVARIDGLSRSTVEQELLDIFASTPYKRNREILIAYYGWQDGRQHTLTEVGAKFGITRERVRQVCAKLVRKAKRASLGLTPAMDRALALIAARTPCAAGELEAALVQQRLTAAGLSAREIMVGAALLGRPVPCKTIHVDSKDTGRYKQTAPRGRRKPSAEQDGAAAGLSATSPTANHWSRPIAPRDDRLVVRPDQVDAVSAIIDAAKRSVYFHGLGKVEQLERTLPHRPKGVVAATALIKATLERMEGFCWLDAASGWFRLLPICRHGLPKAIDKVLAVAGAVTAGQLHGALARNRRLWKELPPEDVLLAFCRQMPRVRVEGDRIISDGTRDWRKVLTGVEAKLVDVLKKHGSVMDRGLMEDLCVAAGMNRFSFHAFVSWSPVIAQYGHSVYGLLGAEVPQEQLDRLVAERRAARLNRRVLDEHGWTDDGRVRLSYRLSKAASTYAVITVPAVLKKVVRGRFRLQDCEGRDIGTLAAKDGRAWGLGAFLRQQGARVGDRIVLTLDVGQRMAVVSRERQDHGLPSA